MRWILALACLLAAVAATPLPSPAPSASPSPAASTVPSASSVPSASPSSSASPSPAPTPTILMLPPEAPPQILYVDFTPKNPHAGEMLSGVVLTSSNVASVEVRIAGFGTSMPKTDVGHFEGKYQVPRLPFFMSHSFQMEIIARNTAGASVEQSLPLQIR